jgi:zinc transporter
MLTEPEAADVSGSLPDMFAYRLDGIGGGTQITPEDAAAPGPNPEVPGFVWLHLRRDGAETTGILGQSGLDAFVVEALTADETRPRCTVHEKGVLVNLRGVNLNPGAEPEDMVSVRLWIEERRVVGIWVRPLRAVSDLRESIKRGQSPISPGDLVAKLALRLADRAEPSVAALNERIDELEELVLDPDVDIPRASLSYVRRSSIVLRRYIMPQRDALTTLEIEDLPWLTSKERGHIREAADRVNRLGEELDAIRDRAQVVHDQIMDQRAERMNRRMLLLAIISAIFLPLGLFTGLLGINVGGMPGVDSPWAFYVVCGAMVAFGAILYLCLRALGMFR